jgi:hypothetical protein
MRPGTPQVALGDLRAEERRDLVELEMAAAAPEVRCSVALSRFVLSLVDRSSTRHEQS